jgi:uncharacterized Zn finger protein (UPF0148 family)
MSDFDREAEREKLREQFERDKQKREQSERMSELLLKGATMTNKHCDTCGDPIFRHDGQEFCPTCHGPGQQQVQHQQTQQQQTQPTQQAQESGGATRQPEPEAPSQAADPTDAARAATEVPEPEPGVEQTPDDSQPAPEPTPRQPAPQQVADAVDGDDLSAARASLTRSLSTLAEKAEATDDLSRKREYLAAAKEAAEALDAAERVGR